MAFEGITIDLGSTDHIEGEPGEAKFLPGPQGPQGETGEPGVSVSDISVERTSGTGAAGTTDTYTGTVTFSNSTSTTFTFNVYNGADGQGAGDMLKSVYDTDNDGVVDDSEKLGGQLPAYYAKATNGIYYAKTAGNGVAQVATIAGITQYYDGLCVALIFNVATSRDATININNLGSVPLRDNTDASSATNTDNIYSPDGAMRIFVYDSANSLFRGVYDYSTDARIHRVATEGSNAAKQAGRITQNSNYFHAPCYQLVYFNFDNTAQSALTLNLWNGPYVGAQAPIYINGEASSATNYTLPKGLYLVLWDGTNYYVNTDGTLPGTQAPLAFDSTPTDDSDNPVTSGGVYDALAPLRSVDAVPTPGSTNLVESGGVYGLVSNRNLLDNGWFTVNQRGAASYTSAGYTVDRWTISGTTLAVAVNADKSLTLTKSSGSISYLMQPLEWSDNTTTFTFSIMDGNGNIYSKTGTFDSSYTSFVINGVTVRLYMSYNSGSMRVQIYMAAAQSGSFTIKAAKLEKGSVSTLANDVAPNYAEEFAKCQRFAYVVGSDTYGVIGCGYSAGSTTVRILVPLPVTMRAVPTFTMISGAIGKLTLRNSSTTYAASAVSSVDAYGTPSSLELAVTPASTVTAGTPFDCFLKDGAKCLFSADL